MNTSLGTILTAMVTPFHDDLTLDVDTLVALADHLLTHGSDGLVVGATTGESPTLTDQEKQIMFTAVVETAKGKGTVIAATGSNDTAHSVHLTQMAERAGVDGVLVVAPYYNRPPQRGMLLHFRSVAAATSLPLIIYNIPCRSAVNLTPDTLAELSRTENIVAVKQANPDLAETQRLRELCDLGLYAGNDDMLLDVLTMGGWGAISVASHLVGDRMQQVARLVRSGQLDAAHDLTRQLDPLYEALFATTSPILIKAAVARVWRSVGGLRPPLVTATEAEVAALYAELDRQGLL